MVECVLLCGGHSRRMGREKARLPWQGRELIDVLAERLTGAGPVVLSVNRPGQLSGKPYPRLIDRFPNAGPLGGLYTALSVSREALIFAAACDMPFLTAEMALALAAALPPEADAAVPIGGDGWLHPLCAVYRRRCGAIFREQLAAGNFRLRDALAKLSVFYVPSHSLPGGEAALTNLNTAAAYRAAVGYKEQAYG